MMICVSSVVRDMRRVMCCFVVGILSFIIMICFMDVFIGCVVVELIVRCLVVVWVFMIIIGCCFVMGWVEVG